MTQTYETQNVATLLLWQGIKKSIISAENMVCRVMMKEAGIDWTEMTPREYRIWFCSVTDLDVLQYIH